MKTLLSAILSLYFVVSVFGLTQDVPNEAARKTPAAAGARLTTIMGTIQEDGDKLRFVTPGMWTTRKPLKGTKDTTFE